MKRTGQAIFVAHPRTVDDLTVPHPIGRARPFEIVKTVTLSKIDYENFVTDMLADRQFIEDYSALCTQSKAVKCLFVRQRGRSDGVLVAPERGCFVGLAAYFGG